MREPEVPSPERIKASIAASIASMRQEGTNTSGDVFGSGGGWQNLDKAGTGRNTMAQYREAQQKAVLNSVMAREAGDVAAFDAGIAEIGATSIEEARNNPKKKYELLNMLRKAYGFMPLKTTAAKK